MSVSAFLSVCLSSTFFNDVLNRIRPRTPVPSPRRSVDVHVCFNRFSFIRCARDAAPLGTSPDSPDPASTASGSFLILFFPTQFVYTFSQTHFLHPTTRERPVACKISSYYWYIQQSATGIALSFARYASLSELAHPLKSRYLQGLSAPSTAYLTSLPPSEAGPNQTRPKSAPCLLQRATTTTTITLLLLPPPPPISSFADPPLFSNLLSLDSAPALPLPGIIISNISDWNNRLARCSPSSLYRLVYSGDFFTLFSRLTYRLNSASYKRR